MAKAVDSRAYTAKELSLFAAQVALVLKSGMFLPDGMEAMADESTDPALKRISDDVRSEGRLARALERTGMFPKYMVNMIAIGEEAGKLEQVMGSLATYYEREDNVRNEIKSAVFYPMTLVSMMVIVIAVLLIEVLPVFADVFRDLGGGYGGVSDGMLLFGQIAGYVCFALSAALLIVGITLTAKTKDAKGYASLMRAFSKFGPTKKVAEKVATGRFAFALSMLLESGYSLDAALDSLPDIVESEVTSAKIAKCKSEMANGKSFSEAIIESGLFSGMYAHILGVGFRAGALDDVTAKIAAIYEDETDRSIASMVSFVEPVLIAVLCVVIGAILLSVMLPLMSIMTSIG